MAVPRFVIAPCYSLAFQRVNKQSYKEHEALVFHQLTNLIKELWGVFGSIGLTVPIRDYECKIDTGDTPPVFCKNVHYGQLETPKIE